MRRKRRIIYYFKSKKAIIDDVCNLCDLCEKLENENYEVKQASTYWANRFIESYNKINKAIELIKRSGGYKGICTMPETDTFSSLLEILGDKE